MEYLLHVLTEKCTGCMDCVEACPVEDGIRVIPLPTLPGRWDIIVCRHCNPAPCVEVCEFGALSVSENGAVTLNQSLCTSCKACTAVCPFGAVFLRPDGTMAKCDLCSGSPRCVEACEEGALLYERVERKSALMREKPSVVELLEFKGLR
ncbi:4Fe-4S ferredoxin, iron-sulfur binding protein [Thermococcus sp. 4557]|uniref:4Fe-4S dicluster domain-containing protein n=1 Tax=Thermococcus sp. (strain CGMCC 1.5172 / 4557) TaxID=1042877 RepID=UPI000219EB58|nr:4Fe-4S dicluster domain-containing protein [Thermococcus sp. 4557]AEK72811.1 4Fe-4S ferredoxin, iron-sulfur binding protein [Thermococcus sp. 4557]